MSKKDDTYISANAALTILTRDGDYTVDQAVIILTHSLSQMIMGATYYPMSYIYKRAKENAAKQENDANSVKDY